MGRPSYKEINRKIKQAKEAVSENRFSILNPFIIAADALELGLALQNVSNILLDLLDEIIPNDYVGQYPPQRSYEHEIEGYELLAFRWLSKPRISPPLRMGLFFILRFEIAFIPSLKTGALGIIRGKKLGCRVYLKFTIRGSRMWLVSLHEDRKGDERA